MSSMSLEGRSSITREMCLLTYLMGGGLTILAVWIFRTYIQIPLNALTQWRTIFLFALFIGAIVLVMKRVSMRQAWERLFAVATLVGLGYLTVLFLPFPWSVGVALVVVVSLVFPRPIFLQNLLWTLGVVGAALEFSVWVSAEFLVVGLVLCVLYDLLVSAASHAEEGVVMWLRTFGIVPGVVLPPSFSSFGQILSPEAMRSHVLLVTSDMLLPFSLVARAAFFAPWTGVVVLGGMMVGLIFSPRHSLLPQREVMPLIAAGAAVPFYVLHLLSFV